MYLMTATEEVVTTMPQALINTGLGMGTVFLILILISFIIYLLRFVPGIIASLSKKNENPAKSVSSPVTPNKPASAPVKAPVASTPVQPAMAQDTQLVAVITAAIEASMEQDGIPVPANGLVIRSIKKRYS